MLRIILLGLFILPFIGRNAIRAETALDKDIYLILDARSVTDSVTSQMKRTVPDNPSELGLLGNGIIRVYQTVVSSQDLEACNFEPSCSHFSAKAIRRGGFFKGLLLTADRLSRCHFFARPQIDSSLLENQTRPHRKIYDPPEIYLNPPHHE